LLIQIMYFGRTNNNLGEVWLKRATKK